MRAWEGETIARAIDWTYYDQLKAQGLADREIADGGAGRERVAGRLTRAANGAPAQRGRCVRAPAAGVERAPTRFDRTRSPDRWS
jgi:hypothetical protein